MKILSQLGPTPENTEFKCQKCETTILFEKGDKYRAITSTLVRKYYKEYNKRGQQKCLMEDYWLYIVTCPVCDEPCSFRSEPTKVYEEYIYTWI